MYLYVNIFKYLFYYKFYIIKKLIQHFFKKENFLFKMNVKNFYNSNSNDFSNTRHSIWDVVKKFNRSINPKSNILDAGCGNGKNMVYLQNQGHNMTGIDFSDGLLEICKQKNLNVHNSDIRNLPFNDFTFDYVISIAVIHHLNTEEDRIKAINELLRVTKKGGKVLFFGVDIV